MKKVTLLILIILISTKSIGQNKNSAAAGAVAGLIAGGIIAMTTVSMLKESMEQTAVEYFIDSYPDIETFELSTSSLSGTKLSDLSNVSVVTFKLTDISNNRRFALFAFTSYGWVTDAGVDFSKITWRLFGRDEWNSLMQGFFKTAKNKDIPIDEIIKGKLDEKGIKIGRDYIFEYPKLKGDFYSVRDFNEIIKIVYNEKSMNLFLKDSKSLVKLRNVTINKIHTFLNWQ